MRAVLFLAALVVLAGFGLAGGFYWLSGYAQGAGPLSSEKIVFIAPGTGVRTMAAQLEAEEVIAEPYAFLVYVKLSAYAGKMQAGEYQFPAHVSLASVVEKIGKGEVFARKVTVIEGMSSYDIATVLNGADAMRGEVTPPPEGSVLPNTYAYIRNDDRAKLLSQMQAAMTKTIDALWEKRAPNLPFKTKEEALALASIVEKETGIAAERARIAGVFVNRLRIGMKLQSDPTVIYAITRGQQKIERVLYAHLEVDSPYNTYKYGGIPPTAICAPGRAAIEATLNPETHDFLYFVADGTGGHVFARGADEHNANVAKWRAVQRAKPRSDRP